MISDGTNSFGVTKTGNGTLDLLSTNTFKGGTTVVAGTLDVASGGSLASAVTVDNMAILTGGGTINGVVTVDKGGLDFPRAWNRCLEYRHRSVFKGGASYQVQLRWYFGRYLGYDQLNVLGAINLNQDGSTGTQLIASLASDLHRAVATGFVATIVKNDGTFGGVAPGVASPTFCRFDRRNQHPYRQLLIQAFLCRRKWGR